jgi:hypothetical protein
MSSQHALNEVIRDARRRGWHIEKAKRGGHYRCQHKDPRIGLVFLSGTPNSSGAKMSGIMLRRAEARGRGDRG